jgi:hypothetical protein
MEEPQRHFDGDGTTLYMVENTLLPSHDGLADLLAEGVCYVIETDSDTSHARVLVFQLASLPRHPLPPCI